MPTPVAPLVLAASALGFGLWWFWPAKKTGVTGDGGGGGAKKPTPTAAETAAAKAKGAADGCLRGTADAKAGKTPAQASADLDPGGKDHAALVTAEVESGDPDAYFAAYGVAHATCFNAAKGSKTKAMPIPVKYTVAAGETPASVASKFGISVDELLSGLNGYGHGENGTKDNAPYPFASDMFSFTSTFGLLGTSTFLPKGTTFTPTWQAGHKSVGLRPIFRSSKPLDGQWYWYFPSGAGPSAAMLAYPPNDSGFGRIYSDGGLKLVGPWYVGMTLNVPGKDADAGTGARAGYATGPRIGNTAIVGARRAPVDVDRLHADMRRHFSPRASSRHGWPAPPEDSGVDDGTSTLYRSY